MAAQLVIMYADNPPGSPDLKNLLQSPLGNVIAGNTPMMPVWPVHACAHLAENWIGPS